jgi:hypothetical protein
VGQVEEVLNDAHLGESCHPVCALKSIAEKALKATSGDVARAARQVGKVASSRTGVRVHYNLTVKGLEHKAVVLTYSLIQTSGPQPPAPYLDVVEIKTFAPDREPEVVKGSCWVALPPGSGRYYLGLTVYDGDKEVEYKPTKSFPDE